MSFDSELSRLTKWATKDLLDIFNNFTLWTPDEFEAAKYELEARGALPNDSAHVQNDKIGLDSPSEQANETNVGYAFQLKDEMDSILHNLFEVKIPSKEYISSSLNTWNKNLSSFESASAIIDSTESDIYKLKIFDKNYTLIHYKNKHNLSDVAEIFRENNLVCKMVLRQDWITFACVPSSGVGSPA